MFVAMTYITLSPFAPNTLPDGLASGLEILRWLGSFFLLRRKGCKKIHPILGLRGGV
jgi:hypothetical protein